MGKKKTRAGRQAAVAEPIVPGAIPPSSPSPPSAEGKTAGTPASLMDTLEPDTTLRQLLVLVGGILAFPTIVSLAVKFLVLPMLAGR